MEVDAAVGTGFGHDVHLVEPVSGDAVIPPDASFPGSIRVPGTGMAQKFGGNVRIGVVDSLDPIGSTDRFVTGSNL